MWRVAFAGLSLRLYSSQLYSEVPSWLKLTKRRSDCVNCDWSVADIIIVSPSGSCCGALKETNESHPTVRK